MASDRPDFQIEKFSSSLSRDKTFLIAIPWTVVVADAVVVVLRAIPLPHPIKCQSVS